MSATPVWCKAKKNDVYHLRFVVWKFAAGRVLVPAPTGCHVQVELDDGTPFWHMPDVQLCPLCEQINVVDLIPDIYQPHPGSIAR